MALFRAKALLDELIAGFHRSRPADFKPLGKLRSKSIRIHPQACTTPKIRQEIKDFGLSDRDSGHGLNISRATAAKWLKRDDVQDRSHRAHTLHTKLSAPQEAQGQSLVNYD